MATLVSEAELEHAVTVASVVPPDPHAVNGVVAPLKQRVAAHVSDTLRSRDPNPSRYSIVDVLPQLGTAPPTRGAPVPSEFGVVLWDATAKGQASVVVQAQSGRVGRVLAEPNARTTPSSVQMQQAVDAAFLVARRAGVRRDDVVGQLTTMPTSVHQGDRHPQLLVRVYLLLGEPDGASPMGPAFVSDVDFIHSVVIRSWHA